MTRRSLLPPLLALAAAATLAGCTHTTGATTQPVAKPAGPGQHDRLWASKAYQLNLFQTQAGRLAASRATEDRIRNLARMMVDDYSTLGGRLDTHAGQHHLALPQDLDPEHADLLRQLADVPPGPDFDRSYLNLELRTHHELIRLYQDESDNGEYPGARAIAQETLPDLYARQRRIRQLRPGTWTSPAKPTGEQPDNKPAAAK